jgi:hypothetical protein
MCTPSLTFRIDNQAMEIDDETLRFEDPGFQYQRENQALRNKVKQLEERNRKLSEHIFALDGDREYATPNELNEASETWYSAIEDYCLRTFSFPSKVDPRQLSRTWNCDKFELLDQYGLEIFHYLTAAWIYELLSYHISQHFMVGICESMGSNGPNVDASLLVLRRTLYDTSESRPSE